MPDMRILGGVKELRKLPDRWLPFCLSKELSFIKNNIPNISEKEVKMLGNCLENVRKTMPLVHNITNYVTVNDVANVLLACGGCPIMSDEPDDVADINSICG